MEEMNGSSHHNLSLKQVRDNILKLIAKGHSAAWKIGDYYNYVVENKLAERNGYASAQDFFSKNFTSLAKSTLSRYGAVAKAFTEESCTRHGVDNLISLLAYGNAAHLPLSKDDPGSTLIDVVQDGGVVAQKSFAECTRDEVRLATRNKKAPSRSRVPDSDEARIQALRTSLEQRFEKTGDMKLNAHIHGGRTVLTIQRVPLEELERFMEALLDGLQPALRAAG